MEAISQHQPVPRADYRQHLERDVGLLTRVEANTDRAEIDSRLLELVRLRVSQINGCVFCVELHTRVLRLTGETNRRIDLVAVWEEANCFSAEERAAFRWAETLTHLGQHRVIEDELYAATVEVFGEKRTCELTLAVCMINTWNRFGVAFRTDPQWIETILERMFPDHAGLEGQQ